MTTTTHPRSAGDDMTDSTDLFAWAVEYARRGWSLVALHAVEYVEGLAVCTCGNRDVRHRAQAGKHPRDGGWQRGDGASPMWWQRGQGNIGIRTGKASEFWVLDYDVKESTLEGELLLERLHRDGYAPHVRTGGGGYHWRFTLPDFEVRNRQSAGGGGGRTHALPMGWDVRGEGGQVVAPPSVTAKGAYVELEPGYVEGHRWTPYTPPGWLLEMIRPQVHAQVVDNGDRPDHVVSHLPTASALVSPGGSIAGSAVGEHEGSLRPADQVQAYCTAALYAEVAEYSGLLDGRRGDDAFSFGCSLVELANTVGWPHDAVYAHYENAMACASRNGGGGGYAPHEWPYQWERARAEVGDRKRVIPPRIDVMPPFPSASQVEADGSTNLTLIDPGSGGGSTSGVNGVGTASTTVGAMPAPEVPPVRDPWQQAVENEARKIVLREHAKDLVQQWKVGEPGAALERMRAEIIDAKALKARPRLRPLVEGLFYRNTLARLNGASGAGKSFVALSLAAAVAAGTAWAGRAVSAGPVVILVAEGEEGVGRRIEAWEQHHGREFPDGVLFLPRPVQVTGPEWPVLTAALCEIQPALVIGDTQARLTVGVDEIDNTQLGEVVDRLDGLRVATGACVLLLHHFGVKGERGRGGTAITGALQTEVGVRKLGSVITMENTKSKDDVEIDDVVFDLVPVTLQAEPDAQGFVDPGGAGRGAVAVWRAPGAAPVADGERPAESIGHQRARALYGVLLRTSEGLTRTQMLEACRGLPGVFGSDAGNAKKAMYRAFDLLIDRSLVLRLAIGGERYRVVERERHGDDGVLTPNEGEWAVPEPTGWFVWKPIQDRKSTTESEGQAGGQRSTRG